MEREWGLMYIWAYGKVTRMSLWAKAQAQSMACRSRGKNSWLESCIIFLQYLHWLVLFPTGTCQLLSFNGPLAHGEHPTFQNAKDPPASWGATFSCILDDLVMLRSPIVEFYMVDKRFKTFDDSQNKRLSNLPCHKSWLVIGDSFIVFSSLCDFLMEHFTPNVGLLKMFDVTKTFSTCTCVEHSKTSDLWRVCVVTFGWELVVLHTDTFHIR